MHLVYTWYEREGVTQQEIEAACINANNAHDFIMKLPKVSRIYIGYTLGMQGVCTVRMNYVGYAMYILGMQGMQGMHQVCKVYIEYARYAEVL